MILLKIRQNGGGNEIGDRIFRLRRLIRRETNTLPRAIKRSKPRRISWRFAAMGALTESLQPQVWQRRSVPRKSPNRTCESPLESLDSLMTDARALSAQFRTGLENEFVPQVRFDFFQDARTNLQKAADLRNAPRPPRKQRFSQLEKKLRKRRLSRKKLSRQWPQVGPTLRQGCIEHAFTRQELDRERLLTATGKIGKFRAQHQSALHINKPCATIRPINLGRAKKLFAATESNRRDVLAKYKHR